MEDHNNTTANATSIKDFLFRYRKNEIRTIEAFSEGKLFFSTPSVFNDPFDSVVFVDKQKLLNSIEYDIRNHFGEYLQTEPNKQVIIDLLGLGEENCFDTPHGKDMLDGFIQFVSNISSIAKEQIVTNSKVICFSEDYLSPLMWAHYANYHKGFVLGYAKSDLNAALVYDEHGSKLNRKTMLDKVKYSKATPDSGPLFYDVLPKMLRGESLADELGFFEQVTYNKTDVWSYEKEWRLCSRPDTLDEQDAANYISIEPCMLLLGAKMPLQERKKLYSIATKKDIPVFEVWINDLEPEFKLNFCLVKHDELK